MATSIVLSFNLSMCLFCSGFEKLASKRLCLEVPPITFCIRNNVQVLKQSESEISNKTRVPGRQQGWERGRQDLRIN